MRPWQLMVGDIKITALSDGRMSIPYRRLFPETEDAVWDGYRARFPEAFDGKGFLTNIGSFLVQTGDHTVIADTGLGPWGHLGGRFEPAELINDLRIKGIDHADIDTVFLTHLHGDHVGWNLTKEDDGYVATFPSARYLLQEADWLHFTSDEYQAKLSSARRKQAETTYLPLRDMGKLDVIRGDKDFAPGLTALHTPGHTPGHMSMLIASRNERAVLIGDIAGTPAHLTETNWLYAPDTDKELGMKSRLRVIDMAEKEKMVVLGAHMTRPGWGRLIRWEGKRYWQALEAAPDKDRASNRP
ncbi:MAG: MBL fold metallo-hydrolase [SAR202 cluster bacterium]|nr:MBL fold metallo-hydrolase [SAR202 cluster bacterium]